MGSRRSSYKCRYTVYFLYIILECVVYYIFKSILLLCNEIIYIPLHMCQGLCAYLHVYVYMHVYICVCICMYACICICICICMDTYVYMFVCVCACMYVYICVFVCLCVCVHLCAYVCVYVCLLEHIVDLVLPESQCGFRRGRRTINIIFVAWQQQEKCREQHQDLAFVDLTKAFDIVNRLLLWNILRKFGCPPTFIAILQQFHTGMCAKVVMAGSQSSSFPVEVGVKQGCVQAPIIFNLLLVAMILVSHRDLQSFECVGIEYRLDGGIFDL